MPTKTNPTNGRKLSAARLEREALLRRIAVWKGVLPDEPAMEPESCARGRTPCTAPPVSKPVRVEIIVTVRRADRP